MQYININKSLREIIKQFSENESLFSELKNNVISQLTPISQEKVYSELVPILISSTTENFIQSVTIVIDTIYNTFIQNKVMDLDEIDLAIKRNKLPGKLYKNKEFAYDIRKECFIRYLNNYITIEMINSENVVELVSRIPLYFGIPVHRKRHKKNKRFLKIDFVCNHQGSS